MSIETNQEQIAIKDDLTGLPNRAGLMQELEADSINEAGNFALVFIDVDGLKHTNDTLGHKAGDQLILETSQILSSGLRTDQDQANYPRESDSVRRDVFRMGGDEFVLKLSNVRTQEDVNNVIERLQQKLVNEGSNGGIKHPWVDGLIK
jgi:diguanylate cyclase (GGDEF)-like protein